MNDKQCEDGAACHHSCGTELPCFRRLHASPLSDTGCETWAEFDRRLSDRSWDRFNKVIHAINEIDIAMLGEKDAKCLRLAEEAKERLRAMADHYMKKVRVKQ